MTNNVYILFEDNPNISRTQKILTYFLKSNFKQVSIFIHNAPYLYSISFYNGCSNINVVKGISSYTLLYRFFDKYKKHELKKGATLSKLKYKIDFIKEKRYLYKYKSKTCTGMCMKVLDIDRYIPMSPYMLYKHLRNKHLIEYNL